MTAALLGALLLGTTPAPAQQSAPATPPAASEEAPSPPQPVTVVPAAGDAQMEDRLRRILQSTGWFADPAVAVRDGIVFLEGTADSQEHRRWAGTLAEKLEGTVAVVNRMQVESDVGSTFGRARDEFAGLFSQALSAWPLMLLALLIVLATWLGAKLVTAMARRLLAHRIASPLLLSIVARTIAIPIVVLGVYFVLQVAGLTRLALTVLGGTGLAGIIIGFGFRDIAENFLASLLLSIRNPFRRGDLIHVAGHTGIVQNLNTRSTVLLTLEGNHVQIPNAAVFKDTITNYSSNASRRAVFTVGIAYDSPVAKAQRLITEILNRHPAVLDAPEPLVLVDNLGAATVNLQVTYWFDSATYSPAKINSALLRQSKNALLTNGIELPDPAREVVFPKGVPIVQGKAPAQPAAAQPAAGASEEDATDMTTGEGGLSNETVEVRERAEGAVPESGEELLKK